MFLDFFFSFQGLHALFRGIKVSRSSRFFVQRKKRVPVFRIGGDACLPSGPPKIHGIFGGQKKKRHAPANPFMRFARRAMI